MLVTTSAFKEWALICDAIDRGDQSIILRKGGIAEGRGGFSFRHREFFLFPTLFHEQVARTRLPQNTALPQVDAGTVQIALFARAEWITVVRDWATLEKLTPFHVWNEEEIRARFDYETANEVHLAFIRAWRLQPEWSFPMAAKYGGCRSWITLPEPPDSIEMQPVLTDEAHQERDAHLKEILAGCDLLPGKERGFSSRAG